MQATPDRWSTSGSEPACLTSLDSDETSSPLIKDLLRSDTPPHGRLLEQSFRHGSWAIHRYKTLQALQALQAPTMRVQRFATCGSAAWILAEKHNPSNCRLCSNNCRDRFCVPCQRDRSAKFVANLRRFLADRSVRFLTLTLRHSDKSLRDQIAHLLASWRKLRRESLWKQHVTGGIVFLEVKRSKSGLNWHPHLHALIEGTYLPQSDLSSVWLRLTRTSSIVHICKPQAADEAAKYVAKYCGKALAGSVYTSIQHLTEAIAALRSVRLVNTFGSYRAFTISQHTDEVEWIPVAPLWEVLRLASDGNDWAIQLLRQLRGASRCNSYQTQQRAPPNGKNPSA